VGFRVLGVGAQRRGDPQALEPKLSVAHRFSFGAGFGRRPFSSLCGRGGVFSIRRSVSSNRSSFSGFVMATKLPYLSNEHQLAISNVSVHSAYLDGMIEVAISALMGERPTVAEFILKNMNGDRYVTLAKLLLQDEFRLENKTDEIDTLFAKIAALRSQRNEVIHWIWGPSGEDGTAKHASMRPYRPQQVKTKTAAEIATISDGLWSCGLAISDYLRQLLERENRLAELQASERDPLLDKREPPSRPAGLAGLAALDPPNTAQAPGRPDSKPQD
jgi:hypothetical protein